MTTTPDPPAPHQAATAAVAWPPPPPGALLDLAETMTHAVAILDTAGRVTWANRGFTRLTGFGPWDTAGRSFTGLVRLGGADEGPTLDVGDALATGRSFAATVSLHRKDGARRWADLDMHPVADPAGTAVAHVVVLTDATEREQTSTRLAQAERLATIGRLAAGVAHEIATPVQFVGDSVHFLQDAMTDLATVVVALQRVRQAVTDGAPPAEATGAALAAEDAADLEYLLENMPRAIESCVEGLNRVNAIVHSLKEFAHPHQSTMASVDLNHVVRSTLTLARNEFKYVADLDTDFGALPPVICIAGGISQVVLNLVVNAAHAISDVVKARGGKGHIAVATALDGANAVITVRDTGGGIADDVRPHIFEPFYTTKAVGKGTGQGLALAWAIVAGDHGGAIEVDSTPGQGATFRVRLPIAGRAAGRLTAEAA
jgi:two-component system NtrC family sensor kinase